MKRILIALLLVGSALPRPGEGQASSCFVARPPGAVTFDLSLIDSLAGTFDLVVVGTAPKQSPHVFNGRLELWHQDTTFVWRYWGRELPDAVRHRQPHLGRYLGGAFDQLPPDTTEGGRQLASRNPRYPGVEWYRGVLRMGSRDVMDGTGNDLTVEWVAPGAFGGSWKADLGIAVIVDKDGPLPNPSGHFCARRRGA